MVVRQRRLSEGKPMNQADMMWERKEQVAGMKGYPVEEKALVTERHSGMYVNEQKLRRSLGLEKWKRPDVDGTW